MVRTLKDNFWNLIEYVTYRQEKDRGFERSLSYFIDNHRFYEKQQTGGASCIVW